MKKYFYIILSAISIAFWYACTPPLEGVTLKLPVALKGSNVIIQYKPDNGSAGELPKTLSVKIAGKDSLQVVDIIGGRDFVIKQNVLSLAAKPGITPSKTSPINITVVVEADGYLKSITPVTITSTNDLNLTVELTKISAPAKGITVVQQPATVASTGTTSAAISVVTPANNSITEKSTVTIPANITMKDGNGATVGGGINIVVTRADAAKTSVQIPLTEISKTLNDNNQPIQDFTVTPIVGVDIEITNEQSQKVKNFSGEITVKTEIPAGTLNPLTKEPLKAGDLMVVTTFDEDTKIFKYEGPATLTLNTNGKLEVAGTINHLTEVQFSIAASMRIRVYLPPSDIEDFLGDMALVFGFPPLNSQISVVEDYYVNLAGEIGQYSNEPFNIEFLYSDGNKYTFTDETSRSGIKVTSSQNISKITITNKLGEQVMTVDNPIFTDVNGLKTASLSVPASPNFVNFVANIKCNNGKTTNADNIQVYAKTAGASDDYIYLGKANNNGTKVTGTTTLLKRNGNYDFKFIVGNTALKYLNKKVSSGSDFTINGTLDNTFCD